MSGRNPPLHYTLKINRHAGIPNKTKIKDKMSLLDYSSSVCNIGSRLVYMGVDEGNLLE